MSQGTGGEAWTGSSSPGGLSHLRLRGVFDLAAVDIVVLEANGEISVIPRGSAVSAEMMEGISARSDDGDDPREDPHPLTP